MIEWIRHGIQDGMLFKNTLNSLCIIAANLLPARVVAHALVRAFAHATTGRYGHEEAPGISLVTTYLRWVDDNVDNLKPVEKES